MAHIARRVDLTAGSLYHHFPAGKRDLLLAVLNEAGMNKRMLFYFASIPLCLLALVLTYLFLWYSVVTTDASVGSHHRFKVIATITSNAEVERPASNYDPEGQFRYAC